MRLYSEFLCLDDKECVEKLVLALFCILAYKFWDDLCLVKFGKRSMLASEFGLKR